MTYRKHTPAYLGWITFRTSTPCASDPTSRPCHPGKTFVCDNPTSHVGASITHTPSAGAVCIGAAAPYQLIARSLPGVWTRPGWRDTMNPVDADSTMMTGEGGFVETVDSGPSILGTRWSCFPEESKRTDSIFLAVSQII